MAIKAIGAVHEASRHFPIIHSPLSRRTRALPFVILTGSIGRLAHRVIYLKELDKHQKDFWISFPIWNLQKGGTVAVTGLRNERWSGSMADDDPTMPQAMPLRGSSKADRVADALRGDIATGRLACGSNLPAESVLLARHDVSRPTYREAIRLLEAEGLLEVRRGVNGGTRVLVPSMDPITSHFAVYLQTRQVSMAQLFEARLTYEPGIAAGVAARQDHDALEQLARCAAAQEFSLHSRVKFNEQERNFRRTLIEHADNPVVRAIGLMIDDVFNRHMENLSARLETPIYERRHLEEGVRAKQVLIRLMADGEVHRAQRAWRVYVQVYLRRLISIVGRDYTIEAYPRDGQGN